MNLHYTPEELAFRDEVRAFCAARLPRDIARKVLDHRRLDRSDHARWQDILAERGWLAGHWPERFGGRGWSPVETHIFDEETAGAGAPRLIPFGINMVAPVIMQFGSPWQQEHYLSRIRSNTDWWCQGYSEPGSGSDLASLKTRAVRDGDHYVVNGSKTFITNGVRADFMVTAVKTSEEGGHHGISFLVLERDMPGYEVTSKLEKMGWHSSDTGELSFTDVEVPAENLLGEENGGFYLIMANFQWERLTMALGAVGGMQRIFEQTLAYAKEREAFGRSIGRFQVIRHKFAEMSVKIEAGRSLTYAALRKFVAGEDAIREVTQAKLFTQRAICEVADEAIQIHGGYGYMREYGVERAYRDARLGPIGGGTDEIMKEILGRQLGL